MGQWGCYNNDPANRSLTLRISWGSMQDAHYETILAKQLVMNRQTWAALQKHGVTAPRARCAWIFLTTQRVGRLPRVCVLYFGNRRITKSTSSRAAHFCAENGK